jgi:hypothetical protein
MPLQPRNFLAELEELGYEVEIIERHASVKGRDAVEVIRLPLETLPLVQSSDLPPDILNRD